MGRSVGGAEGERSPVVYETTEVLWPAPLSTRRLHKSLPHTDNFENVLVQLEGRKKLVIVPPSHGILVYPGGYSHDAGQWLPPHYSPVDFHEPDRKMHPKFFRCKSITIDLNAGDGLYLPSYWWHHVASDSEGRNLAVNYWYPTASVHAKVAFNGMEDNAI